MAEACAIHFRAVGNQAAFIVARDALLKKQGDSRTLRLDIVRILQSEMTLAARLYQLQLRDARLGFEASNQYAYVPLDLVEKVLNCRNLMERFSK